MSKVVTDPVEAAAAVETNLFELFRVMARALPGSELAESETVSMHLAPPTNPMFKGAWRTRVRAAELESAIDATIAWFQERDAPFFFWWTGPQTRAEGFGEALEARGLMSMAEQTREMATGIRSTELGSPGMIADLTEVPLEVLAQVPDGFAISRVTTREDLEDFKRVLVGAYGMPEAMADGWVQAAETVGIGRTPWRMYLGRLNGVPVATNMVLAGAGVTSVYGVATIPEARGQGIGGAITLAPLLEDRDAGIRFAVLFSSMQGVGAYRRIGFREVDGIWIDRYLWRRP